MSTMATIGAGCSARGAVTRNIRRKSEVQIAKFDFAGNRCAGSNPGIAVIDLRLRAQDVIEAAHGSGATLKNIRDPAESDHLPDQQAKKAVESNERAKRYLAAKKLVAALPQHDQKGKPDERLKRRHEHAPSTNEFDIASNVLAVGLVEAADFGFFLGVSADD